ncbi:MAG: anthranilate synthase component I family protein [Myxococcales bacterium]|nr:anthranilate synthase component I family protein [Myxococcales bacterium]
MSTEQILALVAEDPGGAPAWLDGGEERGWFGVEADVTIEADDLGAMAAVDELWREEPAFVWIGQLAYDVGAAALLGRAPRAGRRAGVIVRRYRAMLELGGAAPRVHGDAAAGARLRARLAAAHDRRDRSPGTWPLGPLRALVDPEAYRARVRAVRGFIAAGETYQVNLTQAFAADWDPAWAGQPLAARAAAVYAGLRGATPASMGALLAGGEGRGPSGWVVSNSPETLVAVERGRGVGGGDLARAWPIKGTRPRGTDAGRDAAQAAELLASTKDLAEHVMIVDLVRNDLGRLAVPGSVRAPRRPSLMTLPTVHHLVSEVSCTLAPGWRLAELLAAVFPGGSITGAPKKRTVEIIDELEARPRGLYCGAVVALAPDGLRCSIPIRTGELDADGLTVQSGGGIVIDSDPEAERLEAWAKVRAFRR